MMAINQVFISGTISNIISNAFGSLEVVLENDGNIVNLCLPKQCTFIDELNKSVGKQAIFVCGCYGKNYNKKDGTIGNSIRLYTRSFFLSTETFSQDASQIATGAAYQMAKNEVNPF